MPKTLENSDDISLQKKIVHLHTLVRIEIVIDDLKNSFFKLSQEEHLNGGSYLNGHIEKNGQITNGITSNGSIRSRK